MGRPETKCAEASRGGESKCDSHWRTKHPDPSANLNVSADVDIKQNTAGRQRDSDDVSWFGECDSYLVELKRSEGRVPRQKQVFPKGEKRSSSIHTRNVDVGGVVKFKIIAENEKATSEAFR